MDTLQALIMGIVQGLAEYLPISSSGHLEICRDLLGLDLTGSESLEFEVMLHVATVLSTIVVLWREFAPLCVSLFTWRRDSGFYYVLKILLSCIPVGIVGICFKETIEGFFGQDLGTVGICLCVTAALLALSYFTRSRGADAAAGSAAAGAERGRDISWLDAFVIGCAQAVAVLPGLSRSGTTIATGILLGDKRAQVARFSFLMVIIPILGEALLDVKDFLTEPATTAAASIGFIPMAVGFLASFIVGCAACRWMLDIVRRGRLVWFAVYCLAVGVICIVSA